MQSIPQYKYRKKKKEQFKIHAQDTTTDSPEWIEFKATDNFTGWEDREWIVQRCNHWKAHRYKSWSYPPPPPGSFLYLGFACVWTFCKWNRATCPSWSLAVFTHTGCVRFAHICSVRQSSISGCYIVFHYVNTAKLTRSFIDGHLVSLQDLLWIVLVWAWPFSPYRCTFLWREREREREI